MNSWKKWVVIQKSDGRTTTMFFDEGDEAAKYGMAAAQKTHREVWLFEASQVYEPFMDVKVSNV
jgi:hypothetical protein